MLRLIVLAAVLSVSVADEVAEATATPPLQDALDHLNLHQHLDNPYQRHDRRPDYYVRRNEGRHDERRHEIKGHDERRHDERRHDERRHDERRHDERRHDERSHELKGHDERRHDERRHELRGHDERHHDERPYNVIHDEKRYDELRHDVLRGQQQTWWTDKDYIKHIDDEHDIPGPVILRNIKSHDDHRHLNIQRQNQIVEDVYSPDYAEPTWVIDYRYLKTGGRDYTRGPGGQIIILPKGVHTNEPKEFKNYDELIEHRRQLQLKERSKPSYFMPLGQEAQPDYKSWGQQKDDRRWGH